MDDLDELHKAMAYVESDFIFLIGIINVTVFWVTECVGGFFDASFIPSVLRKFTSVLCGNDEAFVCMLSVVILVLGKRGVIESKYVGKGFYLKHISKGSYLHSIDNLDNKENSDSLKKDVCRNALKHIDKIKLDET